MSKIYSRATKSLFYGIISQDRQPHFKIFRAYSLLDFRCLLESQAMRSNAGMAYRQQGVDLRLALVYTPSNTFARLDLRPSIDWLESLMVTGLERGPLYLTTKVKWSDRLLIGLVSAFSLQQN